MNKILLIIKREYLTRIRNKTFILTTILTPLFFIGLFGATIYFSSGSDEEPRIAVYDESGMFYRKLVSNKNIEYIPVPRAIYDSFASGQPSGSYNGVLFIPDHFEIDNPSGIIYLSDKLLGLFSQEEVNDNLNEILRQERMIQANIDTAKLAGIYANSISIDQKMITGESENQTANAAISSTVGYFSGFLIYMLMFIYGAMVMRGIMEEKVSRVAELMISSVKPFQLMMGKIVGIGAVGLTQFVIWITLLVIGLSVFGTGLGAAELQQTGNTALAVQQNDSEFATVMSGAFDQLNLPLLVGAFIFYFIFGYLFYAALFAAVGSAVNDDPQDAQAMMFPITIPIIFSIIALTSAITNPTGSLAVWCSIIPFTSPVIMMARLPFGFPGTVTGWELGASAICLVGGFIFTTWLSAKIYRTGILMYGKKASWKDMIRWASGK